jgi:hypothetical protein
MKANQIDDTADALGKGEVVSSILTGSTTSDVRKLGCRLLRTCRKVLATRNDSAVAS